MGCFRIRAQNLKEVYQSSSRIRYMFGMNFKDFSATASSKQVRRSALMRSFFRITEMLLSFFPSFRLEDMSGGDGIKCRIL
jgi:hypothetical protein